jgi:hypothetical protein
VNIWLGGVGAVGMVNATGAVLEFGLIDKSERPVPVRVTEFGVAPVTDTVVVFAPAASGVKSMTSVQDPEVVVGSAM